MFPALHDGVSLRTLEQLDFGRVLERLAERCRTPVGAALAAVPRLAATREEAAAALALTSELRGLASVGERPPLGGVADIRPGLEHAQRGGTLDARDLAAIGRTLRAAWLLRTFATSRRALPTPELVALGDTIPDHKELADFLLEAFDEHDDLRDDASPELRELRTKKRSLHERVRARLQGLLAERALHLQDQYFTLREDRYVLPVRSGERAEVDGIIHGSSQTGHTLFIEPAELVPLNNELKLLEEAVRAEERRVLGQLSAYVGEEATSLAVAMLGVAALDHAAARAQLSVELDATPPTLSDTLALRGARNPVLALRGVAVVANDVALGRPAGASAGASSPQLIVISGPNAGGKTVTLSTLGLSALMARAGLHLPCRADSTLPFFATVTTVLGDAQDLGHDLSTFSGQLARLVEALDDAQRAQGPCLVLLDELAAGTEPEQGAALALAFLEAFADAGAVGAVTTHYDRLKTLALGDPRFQNAAVGFDPLKKVPTYVLRHGNPGSSSACDIARRVGVPAAIVDRAEAIAGDKTVTLEAVLARLETERAALEAERDTVRAERKRLQHDRETLDRKLERLDREGEAVIRERKREALVEVAAARETIAQIVKELQRERDPRLVERRRVKLAEAEKSLKAGLQEKELPKVAKRLPLSAETATPGTAVFVPSLDREGRLESVRGQNAVVVVGDLRLTVRVGELLEAMPRLVRPGEAVRPDRGEETPPVADSASAPAAKRRLPPASGGPTTARPEARAPAPGDRAAPTTEPDGDVPARVASNTCDVRGMRADEAVDQIERFLDALTLRGEHAAYVLHGHGTGRLKVLIRERFQRSKYVRKQAAAHPDHGGDAVTVMWLA